MLEILVRDVVLPFFNLKPIGKQRKVGFTDYAATTLSANPTCSMCSYLLIRHTKFRRRLLHKRRLVTISEEEDEEDDLRQPRAGGRWRKDAALGSRGYY
jgi:hypothetical protein